MNSSASAPGPISAKSEFTPGSLFLIGALICFHLPAPFMGLASGLFRQHPRSLPLYDVPPLFLGLASGLFVASAGFLSAFLSAQARRRGAFVRPAFTARSAKEWPRYLAKIRRPLAAFHERVAGVDWRGDWLPLATSLILTGFALWSAVKAWPFGGLDPLPNLDPWIGAGLLLAAFPLLVLERHLSSPDARQGPEAGALSRLLRLLLLNLVGFAVACFLRWLALPRASAVEHGVVLFTALVAAEVFLRSASYFFLPLPPLEARMGYGNSVIAGLIRFERPSFQAVSASVSRQFGIDLGRSWALGFVRRAAFPLLLGFCFCGWLLTGVTALNLSERAVYEAWGKPRAVLRPGLHVHLPWPFGILRPVEYGVVREIPIVFPAGGGMASEAEAISAGATSIEGPPPEDADRLWDASHPSEASYLVASNRNGRENFEVVNIDLRIIYRIGLTDQAAYRSVYSIDAPDGLIRAAAGRMLARYFAGYTILDVLGQNRDRFIRGFQKELQDRLEALSSGIDILGVVVEAIHPPADAAPAYQDVQAAAIRSVTQVATATGEASRVLRGAESTATTLRDQAIAEAAETVARAKVATTLFAADVSAHRQYGDAFLFERRLAAINRSLTLQQTIPLTVVDHRIAPAEMPTLDLRPAGSSTYPTYASPAGSGN